MKISRFYFSKVTQDKEDQAHNATIKGIRREVQCNDGVWRAYTEIRDTDEDDLRGTDAMLVHSGNQKYAHIRINGVVQDRIVPKPYKGRTGLGASPLAEEDVAGVMEDFHMKKDLFTAVGFGGYSVEFSAVYTTLKQFHYEVRAKMAGQFSVFQSDDETKAIAFYNEKLSLFPKP